MFVQPPIELSGYSTPSPVTWSVDGAPTAVFATQRVSRLDKKCKEMNTFVLCVICAWNDLLAEI